MKRWVAIAVSLGVFVLGAVVLEQTYGGPDATLVQLSSIDRSTTPERDDSSLDDGDTDVSDDGTSTTVADTIPGVTTTIPPRAEPLRLPATGAGPLLGTLIVVDPGHNGQNFRYSDVGRAGSLEGDGPSCNTAGSSTNAGLNELTINWEVGTRLAALLRELGAEVILTHADVNGFGPCADERGAIARDSGATAFVSIHADGSDAGSSGFHVIYPAPKPTLDAGLVAESGRLARLVRDEFLFMGGRPANYVGTGGVQERGDLANLNTANRPSILAELGNLRNGLDATMLSAPTTYQQFARGLARAVVRFVGKKADHPLLSLDVTGDGLADLLPGAPQAVLPPGVTTTVPLPGAPTTTAAPGSPTTTPTTGPGVTEPPPTTPDPTTTTAPPETTTTADPGGG